MEAAFIFGVTVLPFLLMCWLDDALDTTVKCPEPGNICKCAKMSTDIVGCYDVHFEYSIKQWLYSVRVMCYQRGVKDDIRSLFVDWNDNCNIDTSHIISSAIQSAENRWLAEVDAAKEEHREERFGVSSMFDYHNLPRTLQHNDHVDMVTLIEYLDDILEEDNGE